MKNNILITGANGFIGSRIKGGRKFEGRLSYASLRAQTYRMRGIVHLAAKSDSRICLADPTECIESNLMGLCHVLQVAYEKKLWVLFISTYQIRDATLYGMTKLLGEILCYTYAQKGLRVQILRLPIVYGPGERSTKLVSKLISELESGKEPEVRTDQGFHFLFVDDAISMIESQVSVLEHRSIKSYKIRDLVSGIKECMNARSTVRSQHRGVPVSGPHASAHQSIP